MATIALHPMSIKVVGTNGQISIGKQFAGRQVLIEEQEPGVWLVRTASVIPDNERWLHTSEASVDLQNALAWASNNSAADSQLDQTLEALSRDR